jgi:tRNA-(ms[2]io[6]A)-hydroxylase
VAVVAELAPAIVQFFDTPTSEDWLDEACRRLPDLLLDHANCELKAASTALGLIYRYPEKAALVNRMSRLAREELRHFEQVRGILADMSIPFRHVPASRYAGTLRRAVRQGEPAKLLDMLLVGALIEARSCERFAALVPRLPQHLAKFYNGLLNAEARHFAHYLEFAESAGGVSADAFAARLAELKKLEADLISSPDEHFGFHSGIPRSACNSSILCG